MRTGEQIELARARPWRPGEEPVPGTGRVDTWQVNGRYAVATVCRFSCSTVLYDIDERRFLRARGGFAPPDSTVVPVSVSANGTLYFANGGTINRCASAVDLLSGPPGATRFNFLVRIPRTVGVGSIYVDSRPGGRTTVYYTRGHLCRIDSDAYALDVREPLRGGSGQ